VAAAEAVAEAVAVVLVALEQMFQALLLVQTRQQRLHSLQNQRPITQLLLEEEGVQENLQIGQATTEAQVLFQP
jgi:hypothetical protein